MKGTTKIPPHVAVNPPYFTACQASPTVQIFKMLDNYALHSKKSSALKECFKNSYLSGYYLKGRRPINCLYTGNRLYHDQK